MESPYSRPSAVQWGIRRSNGFAIAGHVLAWPGGAPIIPTTLPSGCISFRLGCISFGKYRNFSAMRRWPFFDMTYRDGAVGGLILVHPALRRGADRRRCGKRRKTTEEMIGNGRAMASGHNPFLCIRETRAPSFRVLWALPASSASHESRMMHAARDICALVRT